MRLVLVCLALVFLRPLFAAEPRPSASATNSQPRINVNFASQEMLETLPGVGPKLAQEIIAARPFRTLDELDRVKGIGPAKLAKMRDKIFIGPTANQLRPFSSPAAPTNAPPAKINVNTASQLELEKLPGIGPARAQAIIAARPLSSTNDLRKVKGLRGTDVAKLKDLVSFR